MWNARSSSKAAHHMTGTDIDKKPLVLVVDDDELFQRSVCRVLQHAGLDTVVVSDGARTLDVAATRHPDLILLDVDVAGRDGRDVLGQLKRDARTTDIPVFMNSASDTHQERWVALQLGAADYFGKPFPVHVLAQRILSHLRPPAHVAE
jgi:two-component system KDP operon response regulator KdpE